ncbi:MAG: hypothetical protein EOM54_11265 [Clostridia bacterium]|nr:hypothetical protein [Clostridia bacterium]
MLAKVSTPERQTAELEERLGLAYKIADDAIDAEIAKRYATNSGFDRIMGIRTGIAICRGIISHDFRGESLQEFVAQMLR